MFMKIMITINFICLFFNFDFCYCYFYVCVTYRFLNLFKFQSIKLYIKINYFFNFFLVPNPNEQKLRYLKLLTPTIQIIDNSQTNKMLKNLFTKFLMNIMNNFAFSISSLHYISI